jgi:probable HAF family extracellular repeat protein
MNKRLGIPVAALLALALPAVLAAQEHPAKHSHYTLVVVGTFGGPGSSFQGGGVPVVNERGTATGWADTLLVDPTLGIPVFHAFKWEKGVLTDLGSLSEGTFSGSQAINSLGVIVGFSMTGIVDPDFGFEFAATLWKANGQIVNLGTLGGARSITNMINDRGQVVGSATNTIPDPENLGGAVSGFPSPTQWRAALWQEGTIQDLGTLGNGTVSSALFVNARGQVAGVSTTDSIRNPTTGLPTVDPFLWENGHMVDVGTLGGVYGGVSALNNRGQVAGNSNLAGDLTQHAYRWDRGDMKDLGTLGGSGSVAFSLNDEGEVVGTSDISGDQASHGFLWRRGVMTDLGTVAGFSCSKAYFINSAGQIVGESFPCDFSEPAHAFLWENGGPAIDLNVFVPSGSDLYLQEAVSISDRGEIVALGVLPNGDQRAVLLIPRVHD